MMRIYGLLLLLDLVWTHGLGPGPGPGPGLVFVSRDEAQQLLVRQRRANFFLEEMRAGNLERECVEERCDYEEAREIFEYPELTNEFWAKYLDGDACVSSPCLNQGVCKDTVGGFYCLCESGFEGPTCTAIPRPCEKENGGCEHFCNVDQEVDQEVEQEVYQKVELCSCADGYFLSSDNRSCESSEPFKCGAISNRGPILRTVFNHNQTLNLTQDQDQTESSLNQTLPDPSLDSDYGVDLGVESPDLKQVESEMTMFQSIHSYNCPPGGCPWQALLVNEKGRGFCGGTILSNFIILTAAQCMNQSRSIAVVLGEFDTRVKHGNEAVRLVEKVMIHSKFRPETHYNDIALIKLKTPIRFSKYILPACLPTKDFADKVLMHQPDGLVSGFGFLGGPSRPSTILQRLAVPYVDRLRCIEATEARISTRMFCAGYETGEDDKCLGDLGGPHVTRYSFTYFITGILTRAEGCNRRGRFTIYTKVSTYLSWIREAMRVLVQPNPEPNQNQPKRKRSSGPQQDFGTRPDQDPERTRGSLELSPRGCRVSYL